MYSPTQDAGYRDPRGNRPGGWRDEAQREAIENAQPIITPEPQVEPRDYIKEILTSGGGAPGAQPGETFLNREWWRDLLGTDGSRIGIGAGVNVAGALGIGIQTGTPTSQSLAEYADFRKAEAAAAYQDREARFMTGSLGITAMRDKPGYYGQYGTEQDLANQANGDFGKLYNPMYTPSATQTLGEKLDAGEYSPGAVPPQTAEEALRQMWEDVYMNPANKGRGGGIVGWIEERTGIAIDPETFFTEGASSEVLARMLEVFRPDELNYLESHGFLVPVEDYDLPNYNYPAPSYYRSQGGSGGGYGGYGSGPSGQVPRQTYLGLVSWSI